VITVNEEEKTLIKTQVLPKFGIYTQMYLTKTRTCKTPTTE